MDDAVQLRIGALSKLVGVSPELLRAWEQRYGLLQPSRSAGGFRLYSSADEARVLAMQRHLGTGLPAAEAARLALVETARRGVDEAGGGLGASGAAVGRASGSARRVRRARRPDRARSPVCGLQAPDRAPRCRPPVPARARFALGTWRGERGAGALREQHPARPAARARARVGRGGRPESAARLRPGRASRPPSDRIRAGAGARGWSITYLGPDTPIATIEETLRGREQTLVVISAMTAERFRAVQAELTELARAFALGLAGAGATSELAAARRGSAVAR